MKSPKVFKEELLEFCTQLSWEHWTKLGIPGRVRAGEKVNVDPEALILLLGFLGERDLRLVNNVVNWLATNARLIHKSRLKTIIEVGHPETMANLSEIFRKAGAADNGNVWKSLANYCSEVGSPKNVAVNPIDSSLEPGTSDYKQIEVDRGSNRMLLRTLFGTSVRSELLNFFFGGGSGSSRSIAEYTQLSQSTVYTTLREFLEIGLVDKHGRTRNTSYHFVEGSISFDALHSEAYFDWANYTRSIIKAWNRLESLTEAETEYKTRSALRKFYGSFEENLSDWNASFVDDSTTEKFGSEVLMEKDEPGDRLLNYVERIPNRAHEKRPRGSISPG